MVASKNSRNSRRSKGAFASALRSPAASVALCVLVCAAIMAGAVDYFYRTGAILYYGDAEAHLDIARRVIDSRTPGWAQLGTTWLPLSHLLMIPFVRHDDLWQTGLAGSIPAAMAMALAGIFLFAAVRRVFGSVTAAAAATAVFLLNPNTLYLGSIPMTEPFFYATFFALLYFTVRFGHTKGWGALIGAACAVCLASLTRYEGWFLIPFGAVYILIRGKGINQRSVGLVLFCVIAAIGPAIWLAHNRFYFGDALYFYRGPWSAAAIQGHTDYPGRGNWQAAIHYYLEAAKLAIGLPALILGAAGIIAALAKPGRGRVLWPVLLLSLPPLFYVWSIHSASTPIFVPGLWPSTFYNTRYALAWLPLAAFGIAGIARFGKIPAALAVVAAFSLVILHPSEHSITWQESDVNSRARREWIGQAAGWLKSAIGPNETFITGFSDMSAIYRTLDIPLHNTLTGDNDVEYAMAIANPVVFLHTDWAIVTSGDEVQTMLDRARRNGPKYELKQRVTVKGEPALEIYKRVYDLPELRIRGLPAEDSPR
jgi:hypothetical protein